MLRGFGGFAIGSLLTDGGGCLGQHGSLQLHAGPYLGHARLRWQLECGRRTGWPRRLRRLRGSWHPRHLHSGHCRLGRRRRCGQSVTRTFDFVSFDHRLAQRLDLHRRSSWCGSSPRRGARCRCSSLGRRHRDNGCFFFYVIQDDTVLRGGIGDNAGGGCIDSRLAVARTPHARRGLSWLSAASWLCAAGTLGARRRSRRRCIRRQTHNGHKSNMPRIAIRGRIRMRKAIDCMSCHT